MCYGVVFFTVHNILASCHRQAEKLIFKGLSLNLDKFDIAYALLFVINHMSEETTSMLTKPPAPEDQERIERSLLG